ncbi:MAG: aminotransferase class V-fold PLP-dependent enzyme [Flavitalea sp.]
MNSNYDAAGDDNIFRTLGVEPLINCRGTFTIIGGSLERTSVRTAMDRASKSFVQYDELADGIGKKLAEITGAPWGMVSAGCAAGLKHVALACVTGGNPEKLIRVPNLTGFERTEVVIPTIARSVYDHGIRNVGVKVINVDTMEELVNALCDRTALIYLSAKRNDLFPLEEISKIAKQKNIPVLVDAAAEDLTIPCIHLQRGATVVAYSGGKALCGPQCAGLLLGDKELLMSAWQASSPHHGPGRDNKVGREEMIGMLAAVEAWKSMDHGAEWKKWLGWLDNISKQLLKIEGIKTEVVEPEGIGNHSPQLHISWDPQKLNLTGEEVAEIVGRNKPRIALGSAGARANETGPTSIVITTGQMQMGEDKLVADRLLPILSEKRPARTTTMKAPVANIAGHWDMLIRFFSSSTHHAVTIEQDGNWINGSHQTNYVTLDLAGTIEGDVVKLTSLYKIPGDNITYIFSGVLDGESMSGSIYMGEYRTATFKGTRVTKKAPHKPVTVPGGPPLAT